MSENKTPLNSSKPTEPTNNSSKKSFFKTVELEVEEVGLLAAQTVRKEVSRWPALIAIVVIGSAFALLSDRLTIGFGWLVLPVLVALAVPAIITRLKGNHQLNHRLLLSVVGVVTFSEVFSIALLLATLPDKSVSALSLLQDAGILWTTNIGVFALWYWQIDGGGPYARSHEACQDYRQQAEFLFPQFTLLELRPDLSLWRPSFADYLFIAFNTSTAFSPTDTAVLSVRVKWLSMLQAVLSLVTLAALAARAINLL
jgi:hypothetical protein